MLTAYCRTCGQPKADLRAIDCDVCLNARKEAEQHYAAENPGASESDILYAGRQALAQRGHHAHRNYVDPRDYSRRSGLIPSPPQRPSEGGPPNA